VLGLAALASSPALWQAVHGQLPADIALTRYLIAVVIVWAALSALAFLVGGTPTQPSEAASKQQLTDAAESGDPDGQ
jgi:hypothetical protein